LRVVCVKQEIKKPVRPVPISSEPEDCNIIDVEGYKTSDDFSAPTFVQHTEAMLEEIDRMVFAI
jgi:cyclin B